MPLPASTTDQFAENIFSEIRVYLPDADFQKIKNAYKFAKLAHQGQLRKSGEPYLVHPLRTVQILANFHVDEDTIIASMLHDVPEDTKHTLEEIEKLFGGKIAYLVDGITKLAKVHYQHHMHERQIESLKKLFIHSAEDLRVILIKLADRLDNMRTLRFIADDKKRSRIARETLEIYVPIANLLGIGEIRVELEDLCFEVLNPVDYTNIKREIEENIEERNFILEEMIHLTEKELRKNKIEAEIIGRPKTFYSIYRKLQIKKNISNIEDIIAIRVIAPTRSDCYEALGIIHRLFKPKTGRIKDYIAMPKPNGYQGLHTTVFGINGSIVEFQIRTRYMHLEAEYGIAAHYFYKYSNEEELTNIMKQRATWIQRILDIQKDHKDPGGFLENLKLDVFQDRIFIFSPKGDVIDLPKIASAIDFAYAIHTEIGNHAVNAEINGIMCPITATLNTGDTVKIIINKNSKPEREWLAFAKTTIAVHKIKEYLKREPIDKKLAVGKKFLQKEFDRIGKSYLEKLTPKSIRLLSKKLQCKTLDEILIAIGEGSINPQQILKILYEENEIDPSAATKYFGKRNKQKKYSFTSKIGLRVIGDNSRNQFKEIIRTLNALQIPIVKFVIDKPWYFPGKDRCKIIMLVKNYGELAQIFESLEQINGVHKISRIFMGRKILFISFSAVTAVLWLSHPFIIDFMLNTLEYGEAVLNAITYASLLMLFGLVFHLKRITKRSFPELQEMAYYWPCLYILNTLAFFTIIGEIIFFKLYFNWIFSLILTIGVYAILIVSYRDYKKEQF